MPQIALALNTTSEVLELAIAEVSSEYPLIHLNHGEWKLGRELSVQIHLCLAEFMQDHNWSDLAYVAIASGVGSFTSTRIGIVLARTLGEQLGVPVYAVSCENIEKYSPISAQIPPIINLLQISHQRWIIGDHPSWIDALPLYT